MATIAVSKLLSGRVKDVRKVVECGDVVEGLGTVIAGCRDGAMGETSRGSLETKVDNGTHSAL